MMMMEQQANRFLSDDDVNKYINLIHSKYVINDFNDNNDDDYRCFCSHTFFLDIFESRLTANITDNIKKEQEINKYCQNIIYRSSSNNSSNKRTIIKLCKLDKWIIPVNDKENSHWFVFVVYPKSRHICIYDSLYDFQNRNTISKECHLPKLILLEQFLMLYESLNNNNNNNNIKTTYYPWNIIPVSFESMQSDGYNCGIYTLILIELHFINDDGDNNNNIKMIYSVHIDDINKQRDLILNEYNVYGVITHEIDKVERQQYNNRIKYKYSNKLISIEEIFHNRSSSSSSSISSANNNELIIYQNPKVNDRQRKYILLSSTTNNNNYDQLNIHTCQYDNITLPLYQLLYRQLKPIVLLCKNAIDNDNIGDNICQKTNILTLSSNIIFEEVFMIYLHRLNSDNVTDPTINLHIITDDNDNNINTDMVYCKSFDTIVMNLSMHNNTIISSSSPQLKLSDRLYKLKNSFEYDVLRIFNLSSINNVTSSSIDNNIDYMFVELNSIDQMIEFPTTIIENIIKLNITRLIITYFIDITNNNIHINIIEGKIESGILYDMIYNNNNGSDDIIKKTINESFFGPLIQSNYKQWNVMHTNIEGYGDVYHIDIVI